MHTPRVIDASAACWSLAFSIRQPAGVILVRNAQLNDAFDAAKHVPALRHACCSAQTFVYARSERNTDTSAVRSTAASPSSGAAMPRRSQPLQGGARRVYIFS